MRIDSFSENDNTLVMSSLIGEGPGAMVWINDYLPEIVGRKYLSMS